MPETGFPTLIFLFTAYYFVERCLRLVIATYHPFFYQKLLSSRKDLVFFGISMGMLISATSAPFCARGAFNAWRLWNGSPKHNQHAWSLDSDAEVCIAARAVLWVSELNRLDYYSLYVIHHAGSILSLLSGIHFEWPPVLFLTLYSTLFSEIPGDLLWMVSAYMEAIDRHSRNLTQFKLHLIRFNTVQYTIFRAIGTAAVFWMIWKNAPGIQDRNILEKMYAYGLLGLYVLFCAAYIFRQCNSLRSHARAPSTKTPTKSMETPVPTQGPGELRPEPSRPIHLRIGVEPPIIVVPYGLFMGLGFAALVLTSLTIGACSREDRMLLSSALNLTLVFAVFFARLLSIIMEDGVAALISRPLRTLFHPGFWLHGGLFGAAAGALFAYKLGYVQGFPAFAGSLAVGLPIYETFSRIGCHMYGCCYGRVAESFDRVPGPQILWRLFPFPPVRYSHPTHYAVTRLNPDHIHKPLIPIQLISATVFLLLFIGVSLPIAHFTSVELAGSLTLICHAATRLLTEAYRADYRGREDSWLSTTGKMTLFQATAGMAWLGSILAAKQGVWTTTSIGQLELSGVFDEVRLRAAFFATTLGIIVYGVHVGEVGSWMT